MLIFTIFYIMDIIRFKIITKRFLQIYIPALIVPNIKVFFCLTPFFHSVCNKVLQNSSIIHTRPRPMPISAVEAGSPAFTRGYAARTIALYSAGATNAQT